MEKKILTKAEVETHYFGFSTLDLCEDFNQAVIKRIYEVMACVKETLFEQFGRDPRQSLNIHNSIKKLTDLYVDACKPVFKQFQSEVENIFHIPENVELFTIGASDEIPTEDDIQQLKSEIYELTEQLLQEKVMLAKLEQMKNDFDNKVKIMMEKVSNLLSALPTINFNLASKEESLQALTDVMKKALSENI